MRLGQIKVCQLKGLNVNDVTLIYETVAFIRQSDLNSVALTHLHTGRHKRRSKLGSNSVWIQLTRPAANQETRLLDILLWPPVIQVYDIVLWLSDGLAPRRPLGSRHFAPRRRCTSGRARESLARRMRCKAAL